MASRVASVKVVQHAAEVVLDVVVGGPRATERRSGRGEAAVSKEGVHCGEGNGVRQEVAKGVEADGRAGIADTAPGVDHGRLEGKGAQGAHPGELEAPKRRHPRTNVVPHRRPTAVPAGVVVGGGPGHTAHSIIKRHDAMAAVAPGQLAEPSRVDMGGSIHRGCGERGEVGINDLELKALQEIGEGAGGDGAAKMAQHGPHTKPNKDVKLVQVSTGAIGGGKEEAKASKEAASASDSSGDKAMLIGVRADRSTEDSMPRSHPCAVA